jgi:hypothetical protein
MKEDGLNTWFARDLIAMWQTWLTLSNPLCHCTGTARGVSCGAKLPIVQVLVFNRFNTAHF